MVASVVVAGPATAVAQGEGFSDVSEGVHTPAIDALAEKGVFEGTLCGEDMFCPTEPIKRSEMAVWLIRALEDDQLPAPGPPGSPTSTRMCGGRPMWSASPSSRSPSLRPRAAELLS